MKEIKLNGKNIKLEPFVGSRFLAGLIDYSLIFGFTFWYIMTFGGPNLEGGHTVNGLPAFIPMLFWALMTVGLEKIFGVTVSNTRAERVQFRVDRMNAPYVLTKPFHNSQRIIERREDGILFNIFVQINFELERMILGFGDSIEVLKPKKLRERMKKKLERASSFYETKVNN
jgi:hypothetical protein